MLLDEPVELPEGASVEVFVGDDDALTSEERDELDAAIDESVAELARGELEDARAFARALAAKS